MRFKNKWVEMGALIALLAIDVALFFLLIHMLRQLGMEVYI